MNKKGFTIVELLVSILLTSIIMTAVYSVYRVQTHSAKVQENRLEAQEYARSVLDMMVREIRNAAYNPLGATLGASCGGGIVAGTPGIITATSSAISFTYDFQGGVGTPPPPDGDCNDADEEITYQYQAPGPQNCPTGFGDVTRTANGTTQPLTNCNVTAFSLTYYAQNSSTAMSPVVAASVQRVEISVTVKSLKPDTEFGGQLTATMTSNADLRNRGLPS
jgi:type IV pilus assembly protein PilW